jgi:S-DNA-T family DNA segregation ATPase FtsK/SpoIIIE
MNLTMPKSIFESKEWKESEAKIPIALGHSLFGQAIIADLTEQRHVAIAGSTGSGKTVCVDLIIASLLERFDADSLEMLLIDPTVDAMKLYENLPHLAAPVLTHPIKAVDALRAVVGEMERRHQIFAHEGVRNLDEFNARTRDKSSTPVKVVERPESKPDKALEIPLKMARLVIIVSELADLMHMKRNDTETAIARITQMSSAAGIHCIVSTQRPSGKILTGLIKANIPARIAFQVAAWRDSKVILGVSGAEKLKGKGDMLYLARDAAVPFSAQGAMVPDEELLSRVAAAEKKGRPKYEARIFATSEEMKFVKEKEVELIEQAITLTLKARKASASLLQRRLKLSFTRASRLMDQMELKGIIGPKNGPAPREILVDPDAPPSCLVRFPQEN